MLLTAYAGFMSDPKRARSPEHDFGAWWTDNQRRHYRVSWIEDTEELYAVSMNSDRVILLATELDKDSVDALMHDWTELMSNRNSIQLLSERIK